MKAEVDHAHLCAWAAEAQLCTSPWVEVRPITARPHTRPRTPTRDFFRVSHARARGPVHARSMRILPARLRGAHTTTTKNDAATPACHRPMANAKKAAAMSEHVFTAEVVSVTTLATAPP